MRNGIFCGAWMLGLSLTAVSAQAQDPEAGDVTTSESVSVSTTSVDTSSAPSSVGSRGPLRFYGGFHFGGGGNARIKVKLDPEPPIDFDDTNKDGLAGLIGFQFGGDYVVHQYVSIGGEFRFTSTVASDLPDEVDRSDAAVQLWDIVSIKPKGRYEFTNLPLEVYGTLPIGFGLANPKDREVETDVDDARFAMHFGLGAGATYFFTDHLGVNAELMGLWHWFRYSEEEAGTEATYKTRLGQFYTFLNAVYAL